MVIAPASTPAAAHRDNDGAAEIAARAASGPGFWTEWLAELGRQGLLEELLAGGVIARALREAPPGHKYDRVLTAKMTVACVLVACLFPGAGYDAVLATAPGLPDLRSGPGADIPSGSAFSQARKLGEQVMQRLFELDAAVADADLGIGLLWKGLEVTAMELARGGVLDGESGTPADGARPLLRVTAHVRTAPFRWIGAAIGGYHDGENALADQLEGSFRPGMLNLADRGFFSMDRFLRFSAAGAHLAWRVKNGAKSVPHWHIGTNSGPKSLVALVAYFRDHLEPCGRWHPPCRDMRPLHIADSVLEVCRGTTVMYGAHISHSRAKPVPARKGLTSLRTSGCSR